MIGYNSKPQVALVLPSLNGGGAERVMVTLANGFAARGLSVDLVLAKVQGPYLADVDGRVRIVDLKATRMMASLPNLVRYLRQARPEALLSALNYANVIAVAATRIARTPTRVIVSEHNNLAVSLANAKSLRWRAMIHFMRWAYSRADGMVAVSTGVALDLAARLELPNSKIDVIYNPVVSQEMLQQSQEALDHPWFSPNAPPVVVGVGRLTQQKNFALLIRAFAALRRRRQARLLILGEGELRQDLERLVREMGVQQDVCMPGFVSNPYAYMRRASVFVLSSSWEGFGNVLAEAMACGTPVVSTDCPSGPAEILGNSRWGRLVPMDDVEALCKAMIAALDETTHVDVAARAADFSVDQAVDKYLDLLCPGDSSARVA